MTYSLNSSKISSLLMGLAALAGLVVTVQFTQADFHLSLDQTRPIAWALAVALLLTWINPLRQAWATWQAHRQQATPRYSLRLIGAWPMSASLALVATIILLGNPTSRFTNPAKAVMVIIPFAVGLQAAFAFAADDEPYLEGNLTLPRPLAWLLLERLGLILIGQGVVAIIGLAIGVIFVSQSRHLDLMLGWLPSMILLGGLASYITQHWRVAAFSTVIIALVWFLMLQFGQQFSPSAPPLARPLNYLQPFLWMVNPYLEIHHVTPADYWLNRLIVLLLGGYFTIRAAQSLGNSEALLLTVSMTSKG